MQNASPPAAGSSPSWLAWMLYLWYYLGWFGCVLLAKAPLVTLFFPLVSWLLLRRIVSLSQARVVFLLALALVGIAFDALALSLGWIRLGEPSRFLLPLWLVSLWLLFASILPKLLPLFRSRLWLAAILSAVLGPLSYYAGESFQVLYFQGMEAIGIYAGFWGLFLPAAVLLEEKFLGN